MSFSPFRLRPALVAPALGVALAAAAAIGGEVIEVPVSPEGEGPVLLFLAMGQSNMVGNSPSEEEPLDDAHDGRIVHLMSAGTRAESGGCLLVGGTVGQAAFVRGVQRGGPDRMFARRIASEGFRVAVVKWARNGSSIERWVEEPDGRRGEYHGCWMDYFLKAKAALEEAGHEVAVGGLLWSQGAADSNAGNGERLSPGYGERLASLVERFRAETPGAASAPVVVVRTCDGIDDDGYPHKAVVRAAQVDFAEGDPDAVWIDIDDAPMRDRVHHTQEGYQSIGLRAGEAWLEAFAARYREGG